MENLSAFLNPEKRGHLFGVVSDRFKDQDGQPIPWEFRAISYRESRELLKECSRRGEVDYPAYQERVTAASVVFPDLKNAELQKGLGTMGDEVETLRALLPFLGEMGVANTLACEVNELGQEPQKAVDKAKNESGRA